MIETSAMLNILGLALDIGGVILIFRFAWPVTLGDTKDRAVKTEPKTVWASEYKRLGEIGLAYLVFGFLIQGAGSAVVIWG